MGLRRLALVTLVLAAALGCGGRSVSKVEAEPVVPTKATASPLASDGGEDVARVRAHLEEAVRTHGLDPTNAWATGHALLALGKDAALPGGANAIDHIFATWGERDALGPRFPREVGGVAVEPHRDLVLKTLVDAGVSPSRAVVVDGQAARVADLWKGAVGRVWVDGDKTSAASFNDLAWTLHAVSAWAPDDLSWTSEGHAMTLDGLTHAVVSRLEADTAFMAEAQHDHKPLVKQRQGIFSYTCGGAHFVTGAASAVAHGFGQASDREAIRKQAALLIWRFDEELRITDEAIEGHPEYGLLLLVQRLKFVGHFVESLHTLAAMGFVDDDDANRALATRARVELIRTVDRLRAAGAWSKMKSIRADREQTYLDLIGDAAHALHGLDLSTGAATVSL